MDTTPKQPLVVYGHKFCAQARVLAKSLDRNHIEYEWRDVREGPPEYQTQLKELARGYLSVPTVVFPDGSVLVEPTDAEVLSKVKPQGGNPLRRLFGL